MYTYLLRRSLTALFGVFFVALVFWWGYGTLQAFSTVELQGYAWSPNVGWISMNCSNNAGDCVISNYKVVINPDKTLSGYAWSPNVGWIQFGGLSGFPDSGGNAAVSGDYTGWGFSGWVRALAYGDGWDGWISLSGVAADGVSYGLTFNQYGYLAADAYAWGADVVGWVNFSPTYFSPPNPNPGNVCTSDYLGTIYIDMWGDEQPALATTCTGNESCTNLDPVCKERVIDGVISTSAQVARKGDAITISWTLSDPNTAQDCRVASNAGGSWTDNPFVSDPLSYNVNIFTLYCTPAGGGLELEVDSVEVKTIPSVFET